MATGVVDAELARLASRLPDLDPDVRAEVEHAVRRVADKLLHQPTVRVKELANDDRRGVLRRGARRAVRARPRGRRGRHPGGGGGHDRRPPLRDRHPRLACSPAPSPATSPTPCRAPLGREVELVEVTTEGDVSSAPAGHIGGTGVFVSALRDALLRGEVDVAVHSLKDLPTAPPTGSRSPPSRCARTRATSWSPATG